MTSTKDLSGLPNAERLKNFCKGLAALDIIMLEEEWSFIRHYTYNPAWRKGNEAFFATDGSDQSLSLIHIYSIFARALVHCLGAHRSRDFNWSDLQLELALRPHRHTGCPSTQQRIPACGFLPAGRPPDCGEYLGICAEVEIGGAIP